MRPEAHSVSLRWVVFGHSRLYALLTMMDQFRRPILVIFVLLLVAEARADDPEAKPPLEMTMAVACKSIKGHRDYVPLEEVALTRDEKLLVYLEPINHAYEKVGPMYRAHLTEDVNVRRHGEKKILWGRDKVIDYLAESRQPPTNLYLSTTLGLKPLPPGEYDLDIVLHDLVGKRPPARQTLRFRVIDAKPDSDASEPGNVREPNQESSGSSKSGRAARRR